MENHDKKTDKGRIELGGCDGHHFDWYSYCTHQHLPYSGELAHNATHAETPSF